MYKKSGLPEKNDLTICTIKEATPSSVFVTLDEYEKIEGMIHVSEITRKWVRGMKTYLKAGSKLVCQVMNVDTQKNFVNLSSRRVGPGQQRNKMQEWNNEKKANDMLEVFAKQAGMAPKAIYEKIGNKIIIKHKLLYPFLQEVAKHGEAKLIELGADKQQSHDFAEFIQKRIILPKAEINADIAMQSSASDGGEIIKKVVAEAREMAKAKKTEVDIKYLGAPRYKFKLVAGDFKLAEEAFKAITEQMEKTLNKNEGAFEIKRE
ncbi:MAG: S1 RNA-binding domain-containing protein [DPANN group archaeon]|nr:S1 RNA-binding domain-containing protein [DPANN group archaeon]